MKVFSYYITEIACLDVNRHHSCVRQIYFFDIFLWFWLILLKTAINYETFVPSLYHSVFYKASKINILLGVNKNLSYLFLKNHLFSKESTTETAPFDWWTIYSPGDGFVITSIYSFSRIFRVLSSSFPLSVLYLVSLPRLRIHIKLNRQWIVLCFLVCFLVRSIPIHHAHS